MTFAPLPRLRIYTTLKQYAVVAAEILTGRSGKGDAVTRLETAIAARVSARHAVAMPLARVGLYCAVKALIKPGQGVIMSPYTIADVVNMVVAAGGRPVFADIERETCDIDAAEVERLIDDSTGAVLVTHFYGMACDIERIAAICQQRNVALIEDAAQAFGVKVGGRPVGTFGDAGVFSFGMYKNVNAFFGGMVVTSSEQVRDAIREEIKDFPLQPVVPYLKKVIQAFIVDILTFPLVFKLFSFWIFRFGFLNNVNAINNKLKIDIDPKLATELPAAYACRLRPLQARLILGQLDRVDRDTERRIANAKLYHDGLKDIAELMLPPMRTDFSHMYWYFPIQYADRHDLVAFAMRHGRDITESYHRNCAELPAFAEWRRDCPRAQATADSLIYLPTYPRYRREEVERTIAVIRRYFSRQE